MLGTSPSSGCELMHQPDFLVLHVGNCMVVPKEKFIQWAKEQVGGAGLKYRGNFFSLPNEIFSWA